MHLRSITLEGYRSVPPGVPLKMDDLGRFNILIGPNNSGKSTILRFLQVVASLVGNRSELLFTIPWEHADRSWWWQGNVSQPIRSELVFTAPVPLHDIDAKLPGRFEHDGRWRLTITITARPPRDCTVLVAPNVFLNDKWHPVVRNVTIGSADIENLNRTGEYISSSSTDACPYRAGGASILANWAKNTRFYDPVRAIDRDAGRRGLVDGSELLKRIREQQLDRKQSFEFEKFRGRLIEELNALLVEPSSANPIESFEIKGEEREDGKDRLDLYVKRRADEAPIALQYMGTGIAELTVLLADLLQNEEIRQYFMEEPECHLHPGLLRRLMVRLPKLAPNAQFLITSHSNAVLDSTTKEDSIYRFGLSPGIGTSVKRCSDVAEQSRVLDALGVSGSTLLQTNCILWVEGPSDRIYLKLWLRQAQSGPSPALIEGSDFSFVYYGGKVLSHFAFAETGQDDLIALIRVCRYSGVIMDRDTDPAEIGEDVRDTKARIRDESTKDIDHRLAIFSTGREIENDVDPDVFRKSVAKLLNIKEEDLSGLSLSGSKRYPDEILAHLKLEEGAAKTARRKLTDKVKLAEMIVDNWTVDAKLPEYIGALLELIRRSRLA